MSNTERHVKLAICIPSDGEWEADFGYALCQMVSYMSNAAFEAGQTREVLFIDKRTSNLPRSRQECLEDAQLQGCTHALFLDTDQTFPMDTAHRLIAWGKSIVACNIALKTLPSFPTARLRGNTAFGVPLYSMALNGHQNPQGIEKVWRVGCGVMLIDMAILKKMPKPWFSIPWSDKEEQFVGEDWFFVGQAEKAGFDCYVDHDLSRHVGHVGKFQYSHAHIPLVAADELERAA